MMSPKLLSHEIGKVRWWFAGYIAAGGEPPHGLDALRPKVSSKQVSPKESEEVQKDLEHWKDLENWRSAGEIPEEYRLA